MSVFLPKFKKIVFSGFAQKAYGKNLTTQGKNIYSVTCPFTARN